jgi:hypothetical protein
MSPAIEVPMILDYGQIYTSRAQLTIKNRRRQREGWGRKKGRLYR